MPLWLSVSARHQAAAPLPASSLLWDREAHSTAWGWDIYKASYGTMPALSFSSLCGAVRSVKNKPAFFADKLYKSMKVQMGSPREAGLWDPLGL